MKRTAKGIDIPTVMMKTIGKKTYIVENYFSEDARTYVTDKVHRLIDRELKKESGCSETNALRKSEAELPSNGSVWL